MRRSLLALIIVAFLMFAACTPADVPIETPSEDSAIEPAEELVEDTPIYEDGVYYAEEYEFNAKTGWKSVVIIKVTNEKIAEVQWTATSIMGGMDKKTASMNGAYPMVEAGGAKTPWHDQAEKMEKALLVMQDPAKGKYNDEGYTDAVAGVSVYVDDFFILATRALNDGPVPPGPYKDGAYYAEEAEFNANSGWKETVDITVLNGNIVAVNWSGQHIDGGEDKKTASKEGNYQMGESGGAKAPWHEQAMEAEKLLLINQDPWGIKLNGEDNMDALASVSIQLSNFFRLVQKAMETAK